MPTALRSSGIRFFASLVGACALVATLAAGPARAEAENSAAVEKVTKLNKRAVDEYQNLNFDEARKLLKEALDDAAEAGLESHPVTARTYVHLGVVVFAGFKQKDEAIKLFRKALEIQPDIKLDRSLANPEIQEVYDEAVAAQKSEAGGGEKKAPAEGGITHEPVTRATQGSAIVIKATVDPALGAKKVVLSFSADGADDFAEREMKEDPPGSGSYSGEIPSSATMGGIIDYFIEAEGDDDKVLASEGSSEHTHKIVLNGANGQPLVGAKKKKAPPQQPKEEEGPTFFVALAAGSGLGWTTGVGEVTNADVVKPAGFAPATLGHLAPEFGYFLNPEMMVSLQLRLQYVTGASALYGNTGCGTDLYCPPAYYSFAGFGRFTYLLGEGDFRPYAAGIAGFGQIRHVATFDSVMICGKSMKETCKDTVAAGPVFVGAGGGFLYQLVPSFALTVGTNLVLGFSTFTFNIDVNAGVAMTF
jgi:Tfp pilus assembly protein PilF